MSEHQFVRDNNSNAILNTNTNALEQYKISKNQRVQEKEVLQNCVTDINTLKDDMKEIKNLLLKLSEN